MDKFVLHSPQLCSESKEYILKYVKSDNIKYDIHPSWYELCEKQTKNEVLNILKKPDSLHLQSFASVLTEISLL